jgi:BMFP domain-containing protein YqiC
MTRTLERPAGDPSTTDLSAAIHAQCERALRRLRVLARERDDVLLSYALDSVRRAEALSAAQMRRPGTPRA